MMNGWNGAMTWEGWLFMSFLWVLLLGVIVWAATQLFPGRRDARPAESGDEPRRILDRRLASGEIDLDTYEKLRRTLGTAGGVS